MSTVEREASTALLSRAQRHVNATLWVSLTPRTPGLRRSGRLTTPHDNYTMFPLVSERFRLG